MPRSLPLAFAAWICLQPVPSAASVHWLCGLSDDLMRLVCVADVDPAATPAQATTSAVVNGTRFPLDPQRTYMVELWGPAVEFSFLDLLARATLCYRTPDCAVTLSAPALSVKPVAVRAARTP